MDQKFWREVLNLLVYQFGQAQSLGWIYHLYNLLSEPELQTLHLYLFPTLEVNLEAQIFVTTQPLQLFSGTEE